MVNYCGYKNPTYFPRDWDFRNRDYPNDEDTTYSGLLAIPLFLWLVSWNCVCFCSLFSLYTYLSYEHDSTIQLCLYFERYFACHFIDIFFNFIKITTNIRGWEGVWREPKSRSHDNWSAPNIAFINWLSKVCNKRFDKGLYIRHVNYGIFIANVLVLKWV